jgi:hypothetical protein
MNLNEAVNKSFIKVSDISVHMKDSVLKIYINTIDADNDSVLYEVNEINETTRLAQLSDRSGFDNLQSKFLADNDLSYVKDGRVEKIIDDDDMVIEKRNRKTKNETKIY